MPSFILDLETLRRAISEVLEDLLSKVLPPLVEQATRKPYLTREEVKALTGWSDRQLQHLRDSRQIPFFQRNKSILYPTKEFYDFLKEHRIEPRKADEVGR